MGCRGRRAGARVTVPEGVSSLSTTAAGPRDRATALRPRRRELRVQQIDTRRGDVLVDLTIPTNLVNVGFRLGARLAAGLSSAEQAQLLAMIERGEQGTVVDRTDPVTGERTYVWLA
jgi:hypothetical protein